MIHGYSGMRGLMVLYVSLTPLTLERRDTKSAGGSARYADRDVKYSVVRQESLRGR